MPAKVTKVPCVCPNCGVRFERLPCFVQPNGMNFCSRECSSQYRFRGRRISRTCAECGESFEVKKSATDKGAGHYCSMACRAASFRGAGNPSWTGGKKDAGGGYIEIHAPDGRRIREHRYVMEQHVGRRLLTTEHVHHINHNRRDNRIENLVLLTNTEHAHLHGNERRRDNKGRYD